METEQEKTMRLLRRIPWEEALPKMTCVVTIPFKVGNTWSNDLFRNGENYAPTLLRPVSFEGPFEECGWTKEEFELENRKRNATNA